MSAFLLSSLEREVFWNHVKIRVVKYPLILAAANELFEISCVNKREMS